MFSHRERTSTGAQQEHQAKFGMSEEEGAGESVSAGSLERSQQCLPFRAGVW